LVVTNKIGIDPTICDSDFQMADRVADLAKKKASSEELA
jgi:hypothetical protein